MPEINVKQIVNEWKKDIKEKVTSNMKLTVIQIGNNSASNSYIKGKKKDCEELGINFELCNYKETINPSLIYEHIRQAKNPIILQLPVPEQIDLNIVNKLISPEWDVDGFSPYSKFKPCTSAGIIHLLDKTNFKYEYHKAVVIGRSQIVGLPMAKMLLDKNMTITVCHSKTSFVDLVNTCNDADLIVSAVGKENFITDMLINNFKNQTLIDVGINRINGKIQGDANSNIYNITRLNYTPVPGGVGLLTRMQLMENIVKAYTEI